MSTSLTSPVQALNAQPAASGALAKWGPLALVMVAAFYAASSGFFHSASLRQAGSLRLAIRPLLLFSIGIAPMVGASLVVWTSRHNFSPRERRSQLIGAAMSAILFFPALLLVRFFA